MTFPATPLDQTVELYLNGAWVDVTSLIYGRDDEPVTVTRGRSNEATQVERSTCALTANNRDGNFSPRNPVGDYYGLIGRNTPMRVRVAPALPKYVLFAGAYDSNASASPPSTEVGTDDAAALGITGDIDIRIDIQPDAWDRWGQGLCNKYLTLGDERSWVFWINADKTLTFSWSEDGTSGTLNTETSTAAVTVPSTGRLALRVTLDVNNGSGGYSVRFYTASTISGSWSQLGSTVTVAGVTSIFDSAQQVEFGRSHTSVSGGDLRGRVYAFQVRDGIGGTAVVDVDVDTDAGEPQDTSFTGSDGLTWTLLGDTSIVDPSIRFRGEVSEWPSRWDVSGRDVYVPMEGSGILRRLGQGATPLKSALRRGYTSATFTPKAYWPCEDNDGSTSVAAATPGVRPMRIIVVGGTPAPATSLNFASNNDFKCSAALPTMSEAEWTGTVPSYTNTNKIQVFFLLKVPSGGTTNGQGLLHVTTTGTAYRWTVMYGTGGTLELRAYDSGGTNILTPGAAAFGVDGKLLRVSIELQENGADVDWALATLEVGAESGNVDSGTLSSYSVNKARSVTVNPGADLDDVVFGHISVHDEVRSIFDIWEELNAHSGEVAARRIERLCGEESVEFRGVGDLDATTAMGAQLPQTLLNLLRECAESDGGILHEPRDLFGLGYRARDHLGGQDARVTLDYDSQHLSSIEPTEDDQLLRNDVTATRVDGGSFRSVLEAGALSILEPPDGVGRYDEEVQLSLETDHLTEGEAGWRLHMGTVDETRYPVLSVDLARPVFTDGGDLELAIQDLDIGDRLVVTDPPAWLPPDDIDTLAQGFKEVLGQFIHRIDINCSPGAPWTAVAVYGDAEDFYTSDGSTLAEDLTTGETGVDVATASGPLWDDTDGDFDIIVGGERMTVTAVTGASSPQTFTVTRSVNGIVKTHSTGAVVELFSPSVWLP